MTSTATVVESIRKLPGPVRLVAIDGPGGSGKTTFASQLADAAGGAPIVHTDEFASESDPVNWWPRMLEQVVLPLAAGRPARYQRYDWPTNTMAEWITIEPASIIIIEGVSAARVEWAEHLSFTIWIDTPRHVRLERGLERDGRDMLDQWREWMAAEDHHYTRDPTKERADLIVAGSTDCEQSPPRPGA